MLYSALFDASAERIRVQHIQSTLYTTAESNSEEGIGRRGGVSFALRLIAFALHPNPESELERNQIRA